VQWPIIGPVHRQQYDVELVAAQILDRRFDQSRLVVHLDAEADLQPRLILLA